MNITSFVFRVIKKSLPVAGKDFGFSRGLRGKSGISLFCLHLGRILSLAAPAFFGELIF
jgi:hypothetical protein